MKKFLFYIVLFFITAFIIDRIVGFTFSYLSENAKGGYTGHYHYLVDKTSEDVLIFGSSRAIHHYNPQIIEDSLGMTCYNCGQNGNGIILFYGWWKLISKRYHPKLIIYDITDEYDYLGGADNHKYLGWLKEAYDKDGIKEIFESIDPTEKYKMQCMMYRYNSKWHEILGDFIHPIFSVKGNGFIPLEGQIDSMKVRENYTPSADFSVDSLKINYWNQFLRELGTTKIVFVVSPYMYGQSEERNRVIREICKQHNVVFYDFSNSKKYLRNYLYFKDGFHLNEFGADEFTKDFISCLKYE